MFTRKELPRTGTVLIPWGSTMTTSGAIIKSEGTPMTINRNYIHDSISSTLKMRDALDEGGKVDAADAAQVLADRLWAITRPRLETKTGETVALLQERTAPAAPKGGATDAAAADAKDAGNPFEGM